MHRKRRISKRSISKSILAEVAWEVCNQVGGIYTVIRSKLPFITERWGDNYILLGPYIGESIQAEFDPIECTQGPIGEAVAKMKAQGYEMHYGHWLVSGRPKVILFNLETARLKLWELKSRLWNNHQIPTGDHNQLLDDVLCFGDLTYTFLNILHNNSDKKTVIAHFHEWMSGLPILDIRQNNLDIKTIFTTHATLLGRYIAPNVDSLHSNLESYDSKKEAKRYDVVPQTSIEQAAAHNAHVFTTVSDITGRECTHLLGKEPDMILPNGINIEKFDAIHEFQNLHLRFRKKINQFTMTHFFRSYNFDLDKTLYFFTAGRYEYKNKGFDVTLEALNRLNQRLKDEKSDINIVMFFITKRPYHGINSEILHSRALLTEINHICEVIKQQVGDRLFDDSAKCPENKLPHLNEYVDDYWKLVFRRTLQSWKTTDLPPIVTHRLIDEHSDEILSFIKYSKLHNRADDKVKIVYHPEFISRINPLFGIDYNQFVRGCHLGVFPSYYEPWGYTPMECVVSGIPAIVSDVSGFGSYVMGKMQDYEERGIYIINRKGNSFDEIVDQLSDKLYQFTQFTRRQRVSQRNKVESSSVQFSWQNLYKNYDKAYNLALHR